MRCFPLEYLLYSKLRHNQTIYGRAQATSPVAVPGKTPTEIFLSGFASGGVRPRRIQWRNKRNGKSEHRINLGRFCGGRGVTTWMLRMKRESPRELAVEISDGQKTDIVRGIQIFKVGRCQRRKTGSREGKYRASGEEPAVRANPGCSYPCSSSYKNKSKHWLLCIIL